MAENLLTPVWQSGDKVGRWDVELASHLLRRASFGGTLDEVEALVKMGPERAVSSLVNYSANSKDDLPGLEFGELTAPGMGGRGAIGPNGNMRPPVDQQIVQRLADKPKRALQQIQQSAQRAKEEEIRLWWLDRMVRTKRPLEEKMTLFWHGLLVSSAQTVRVSYLLYKQNQLYRRYATGNFRMLIHEVSRDPAMLIYLNNNQNVKAHPNENYARELMELFTLGIGNYTENDIKESARSFTGWSNANDQFIARPGQHDAGIKTFLGRSGNFNGDNIIEIIFSQSAAAKYIATRLIRFFGVDEPEPDVVEQLAAMVKRNDFEMAPVLHTLFASKWFYSRDVMLRQIKSPVQLVVGALRALGVSVLQPQQVVNVLRTMGQDLFNAPTVKGWDGGRAWINTSTLFARYNLPAYLGTGRLPAVSRQTTPADTKTQYADFESGWDPEVDLAGGGVATTDGVVDFYLRKLLGFKLDARKRSDLVEYMNGTGDARSHLHDPITAESDRRTRGLVHLIMAMAEFQLC
ncbi:MAG TPA: DUF1800 domain-containing protein [Bryobacteraceae bacterium]